MSVESNKAYFISQEAKASEKYMGVDGEGTVTLEEAAAQKKAQAAISGKIFVERVFKVFIVVAIIITVSNIPNMLKKSDHKY